MNKVRILLTAALWLLLMLTILLIHGFPDVFWIIGSAWVCLVVSGFAIVILERIVGKGFDRQEPFLIPGSLQSDGQFMALRSHVVSRAIAAKGRELSLSELSNIDRLVVEEYSLERQLAEIEGAERASEGERLRRKAEEIVKMEVKKAQSENDCSERRAKMLAERSDLKRRLRDLGYTIKDDSKSEN